MIFSFFYNAILSIAFLSILPKRLYQWARRQKERKHVFQRIGWILPKIHHTSEKPLVWVHAISLGETKAAISFIQKIRAEYPGAFILLSSVTETGHEQALKIAEVDQAIFFPLDFSWTMKKLLKKARPDYIFLVETDFWYHFLTYAKKAGAKIALVSGKLSERSTFFYRIISAFSRKLFSPIDLFCVQNENYKKRFISSGVDPSKIVVTSNLKFSYSPQASTDEELTSWKEKLGVSEGDSVITLASTHQPEEICLMNRLQKLRGKFKHLKILLAPRHPERFSTVKSTLEKAGFSFSTLSSLGKEVKDLILVDRMGFLPVCFQLSSLAVVGGSFRNKIGGHNILEPCFYQTPVFFGPFMQAQKELEAEVLSSGAGQQVPIESFESHVREFLESSEIRDKMKQNTRLLTQNLSAGVQCTWKAVESLFSP